MESYNGDLLWIAWRKETQEQRLNGGVTQNAFKNNVLLAKYGIDPFSVQKSS